MKDFYRKELSEIYKFLNSSIQGINSAQGKSRLEKYGLNKLQTEKKINLVRLFLTQFKSFIIYILIFATALSFALGEYTDGVLILLILLANALIGFFQELSAEKSLNALKKLNTIESKVYRDGKLIQMDSKELVPGDVIYLEAGDKVPADARIIELNRLKVNESTLTGESLPVEKETATIQSAKQIGDQKNMLFSSTNIVEGTAKAIIVKTGMETEIGKITTLIKESEEELTPLQQKLDRFGKKLSYAVIGICILILGILLLENGLSIGNLVAFSLVAISLAVAAVPEALPAVVTISLSVGVKKLLRKKALVRTLSSVETLGSCDIICTDKTGTLTENEMTVVKAWTMGGECRIEGEGYHPVGQMKGPVNKLLFEIGSACNNASVYQKDGEWIISGDPTEAALIVSAMKIKADKNIRKADEIPFDSQRKMMSVLDEKGRQYTKGAPNLLLERCSHVMVDNKILRINQNHKKKILEQVDGYSKQALRVLAFAYKDTRSKENFKEDKLIFVGLQAMIDPPRKDVIESIRKAKSAGIRVIMITGDYVETAKAIGKTIGITGKAITGEELERLSLEQLKEKLKKDTNIFARVIPAHKQKIVDALQELGHTVAMTGDGVNDAPALKNANIGVAVGSGTDVAKEASDFILLDDSFTNVINAVEEGRGIYDNIQKSIVMLLSGNCVEVLIILLAVIFQFNLPLTAVLLLWINLITDGAPALAFSIDSHDKSIMKRKPILSRESILPKRKLTLVVVRGVLGAIVGLWIFRYFNEGMPQGSAEHILAQTSIFIFVILTELLNAFFIRKDYNTRFFSNKYLWAAIIGSLLIQALVMYTPLRHLFEIVSLNLEQLSIIGMGVLIFSGLYLLYHKVAERFIFRPETH